MYNAGSMTIWVKAMTEYGCADSVSTVITLMPPPTITLISDSDWVVVALNAAMAEIKYVTTVANGATVTGLPPGVSGTWAANTYAIGGTPTQFGTFPYTVTTTNAHGCIDASATGTILVSSNCVPASFNLGTVGFTSTDTYTRNGITISAPVTATGCQKSTYNGGEWPPHNADCRDNPGYDGDLFSWCMVVQYANQLCPSPWRWPTVTDWRIYADFATPNGPGTTNNFYAGMDGWTYNGFAQADGSLSALGSRSMHWTSSEYGMYSAYALQVESGGNLPDYTPPKGTGVNLRCVQDE
jgi:uncharacterized protein (TIGR02145 family)